MTRLSSPWSVSWSIVLVLALTIGALTACSAADTSSDASTVPGDETTSGLPTQEVTVESLAAAVTDTYVEGMQALVALLESRPDPASALPQVQALKEEYIQQFLVLGGQRKTLSEADRAQVDSILWRTLPELANEDWYGEYDAAWAYYQGIDLQLANLVASFNILTQYADFELLKKQSPEEAARLGIQ